MAGRTTTTIEVSLETFDKLMEVGAFPETVDDLIGRLINGSTPTLKRGNSPTSTSAPTTKGKKKRQRRKKIGCEWCDRVFLGGQGYASHLRHSHPEHYHPVKPVPLSERKTVIYRRADGSTEQRRVEDVKADMEREA